MALDVLGRRRDRTDEQRQRARPAAGGDLAEAVVRHSKRPRQPFRRDDSDRRRNLPSAIPQQLPVPDHRYSIALCRSSATVTARQGVNDYQATSTTAMNTLPLRYPIVGNNSGMHRKIETGKEGRRVRSPQPKFARRNRDPCFPLPNQVAHPWILLGQQWGCSSGGLLANLHTIRAVVLLVKCDSVLVPAVRIKLHTPVT
jgi:hypothetical protein